MILRPNASSYQYAVKRIDCGLVSRRRGETQSFKFKGLALFFGVLAVIARQF